MKYELSTYLCRTYMPPDFIRKVYTSTFPPSLLQNELHESERLSRNNLFKDENCIT